MLWILSELALRPFRVTCGTTCAGESQITSVCCSLLTHRKKKKKKRNVCQCGWKQRFAAGQTDSDSDQSVESAYKAEGRELISVVQTVIIMSADFIAVQAPIKSLAVAVIFHVLFFYNTTAFRK